MIFAKELDGLICIKRYTTGGEISDWAPVVAGINPVVTQISSDQYFLVFEFLSHVYVFGIDPTVWPPLFLNPVEKHGNFVQITEAIDSFALGSTNLANNKCFFPYLGPIYLKSSSLFYDQGTTTYSVYISLDFTKFSQPLAWRGYRLYKRVGGGAWTLIGDWASDFQNILVTQVGAWTTEFCATWGWNWDPAYSSRDVYVESTIGTPILTIPSSPITLTLTPLEPIHLKSSSLGTLNAMAKSYFYSVPSSEILNLKSSSLALMSASAKSGFISQACSEVINLAKHSSAGVAGGR